MSPRDSKRIRCKMTFPRKIVGDPILHRLWTEFKVVSNTVRGRITEKGAWLEVELLGPPKGIEKALAYLEQQGVTVQQE